MRIIKPYGRSVIAKESLAERKIDLGGEPSGSKLKIYSVKELADNDKLVMAYWISVIDRIICKPIEPRKKQTEKEKQANQGAAASRAAIGDAAWEILQTELSAFQANSRYKTAKERTNDQEKLRDIWQQKIAALSSAKKQSNFFPRGRWYDIFAKDCNPFKISQGEADRIADKISKHLYQKAYKYNKSSQPVHQKPGADKRRKSCGVLNDTLKSIAVNSLLNAEMHRRRLMPIGENIWQEYCSKAGEFAAEIRNNILAAHDSDDKTKPYHLSVMALRDIVWPKVFDKASDYNSAVKGKNKHLLPIHKAVKQVYKTILKEAVLLHEKQKETFPKGSAGRDAMLAERRAKLAGILPASNEAFYALLKNKQRNSEVNSLIRLGKVIHYTASKNKEYDETNSINNFPDKEAIENSPYWSSQGQTEIKQNEAFVRVWRRALVFAAHNLKNWVDPKGELRDKEDREADILFSNFAYPEKLGYQDIAQSGRSHLEQKFALSFGDSGIAAKNAAPVENRQILLLAWSGLKALRNSAFHFKGMGSFVNGIKGLAGTAPGAAEFARELYNIDCGKRQERLKAVMQAAYFHLYFGISQIETIWQASALLSAEILPLPKLKSVLERAQKAWNRNIKPQTDEKLSLILPPYSTPQEREADEWALCQYNAAKILYENGFKTWLQNLSKNGSAELRRYIETALANTTSAARSMNAKKDEDGEFVVAKAEKVLAALPQSGTMEKFFAGLMSEITAEGRIQKQVYRNDPEKAQGFSAYLENLKCDVIAQAFSDYLSGIIDKKDLFCARERKASEVQAGNVFSRLSPVKLKKPEEEWEGILYFLLHFMPVEEAGGLRQQLKKWELAVDAGETKGQREDERKLAQSVLKAFDLYIAMHDAQFLETKDDSLAEKLGSAQGKAAEILSETYGDFYEGGEADFCKIFMPAGGQKGIGTDPLLRELREMQRFGSRGLNELFRKLGPEIKKSQVAAWLDEERARRDGQGIAQIQKEKIELHEQWIDNPKSKDWFWFDAVKKQWRLGVKAKQYQLLVNKVTRHRQLTAQVTLQNYLRLHRLIMAVLGRLVDFSRLWERDLYFVLLARLYEKQQEGEVKKQGYLKSQFRLKKDGLMKDGIYFLRSGQIVEAVKALKDEMLRGEINSVFGIGENDNSQIFLRNYFAHLAMLSNEKIAEEGIDLTQAVNKARRLMAYDRKLKNAVSKAVLDLLEREKIKLQWMKVEKTARGHDLAQADIHSDFAYHLKKSKTDKSQIKEPIYGDDYIHMLKSLF